ncbi:hypothetical protein AWENTII_010983 [Aspergillus wentii]
MQSSTLSEENREDPSLLVGSQPLTISPPTSSPSRPRHIACARCRRRKVRCDGILPACTNCAKAGVECFEGNSTWDVSRKRLHYLERRVRELESLQQNAPSPREIPPRVSTVEQSQQDISAEVSEVAHPESNQPSGQSPAISISSSITRDQPLAHEVGLLSLANGSDPKYLGPSSGVPFARLIYESAPNSQGLPLNLQKQNSNESQAQGSAQDIPQPVGLPSLADCQQYAEAYLSATEFYPFLLQDDVFDLLDSAHRFAEKGEWNQSIPITLGFAQVFLLLSIGARLLETKLKTDFSSRGLFAAAMQYINQIKLHDSIEGVQVLLLLVIHSLYSPEGLNAWFLLHTIIASCLDLGLQRLNPNRATESSDLRRKRYSRSAIFWSAYSLDRTLTTILGRPLTLRDEAIDVEFPGVDQSDEVGLGAFQWYQSAEYTPDPTLPHFTPCIYSLRFDRIIAEIKLMIYRVSRSPQRFPWPDNLTVWQHEAEAACHGLLQEVQKRQRGRPFGSSNPLSMLVVQRLELKYHQSIMLLFRPSPQIPQPSQGAVQACFNSSMETIRLYAELHRFANMDSSWLSAHSIFVAAITMLYCLWTNPAVRGSTPFATYLERAEAAHRLLTFLSGTWSVAEDACEKLSRLILVTFRGREQSQQLRDEPQRLPESLPPRDRDCEPTSMDESAPDPWFQQGSNILVDELGILRDFFDLGWLNNVSLDAISQPMWDDDQFVVPNG